jgi:pimeloyl-ACP methyl ester carboxylesterase
MTRRYLPLYALCLLLIPSLVRAEDGTFDANGVKLHYTDTGGTNTPVIFVHGYTSSAAAAAPIISGLKDSYRVIALDCRGHGKSEKPHEPAKYGTNMVEDVVRLLDHLKIKKAHLVGYSMGAMISCKLATVHPERFLSVTLGSAGGIRKEDGMDVFGEMLGKSLDEGKGFGPLLGALTPPGQPQPSQEQLKQINAFLSASNDVKALACVARSFTNFTVDTPAIKAIKLPMLAIIGSGDPLKAGVDRLHSDKSDVKVVVIPGANHMSAGSHPTFVKELKAFVDGHRL